MAIELSGVLTVSRRLSTEQARVVGRALIAITQTTAGLLHQADDEAERGAVLDTMTTFAVHGLTGFAPLEEPGVSGTVQIGRASCRERVEDWVVGGAGRSTRE